MKPIRITLHPLSALAGATACALVVYTSSAQFGPTASRVATVEQSVPAGEGSPPVNGFPRARDFVRITQESPYVVPGGRILMITALGSTSPFISCATAYLFVDGGIRAVKGSNEMHSVPMGLTVQSGSTVEVYDYYDFLGQRINFCQGMEAWGYLEPVD